MKKLLLIFLSIIVLFFGVIRVPPTLAISIGFDPPSLLVDINDLINIDVVISELDAPGEIVSAFDLDVTYDAMILSATGVTFGPQLGAPFGNDPFDFTLNALVDYNISTPGRVDFSELSFLSNSDLDAIQGDSVILATLSFKAVGLGTSLLTLDPDPHFGIDVKGADPSTPLAFEEVGTGRVTPVPEPATLLLAAFGLAGLFGLRKKFK